MAHRGWRIGLAAFALLLGACGGGGDDGDEASSDETTTTAADTATTAGDPATEAPRFAGDFDRVCTTQVGFGGTTAYEAGTPGPHLMIFMEEQDDDQWIESARTFPAGWKVEQDSNFEDNSELKKVQLVVCADRVKATENGTVCNVEDDGKKAALKLRDTEWDVIVYEAKTGKEVTRSHLAAANKECPMFMVWTDGDTTYDIEPSEDEYTNALKPTIAP